MSGLTFEGVIADDLPITKRAIEAAREVADAAAASGDLQAAYRAPLDGLLNAIANLEREVIALKAESAG
ncbi:hypothetical protein GS490_15875 [Rhodococcus hoagii]|nr:hypothetical protein [Prescottella equi]